MVLVKYCIYCVSAPSLYRESTDSLIHLALHTCTDGFVYSWLMITTPIRVPHLWPTTECTYCVWPLIINYAPWLLSLVYCCLSIHTFMEICWTTFLCLFSDILQPWVQPDLRRRSSWIGCSFASEPEPSGAKVSPAIHVLLLKRCTLIL